MMGAQVGYYLSPVGFRLDAGYDFDIADNAEISAKTFMGDLVLTVPIHKDKVRPSNFHLFAGGGKVRFEGEDLPPSGLSADETTDIYGGGIGMTTFYTPHLGLMWELRIMRFGNLARMTVDSHTLGRFALGAAFRL
jgi:hypothetical protein